MVVPFEVAEEGVRGDTVLCRHSRALHYLVEGQVVASTDGNEVIPLAGDGQRAEGKRVNY